ncbi:MFS transporter [Nocardia puris]|uniref:MFS transporter n=1 Tax=Nocardia puris TaxID=208602 RepID=UPI001E2A6B52|nr:MFS transporter [Nocardia puris]
MSISGSKTQAGVGRRVHPAWTMVGVAALVLVAAGSFTTLAGLITEPLVESRGWTRTGIGIGVAVNMVLYGVVAPFTAALMDRYGVRRITSYALGLLVVSSLSLAMLMPSVYWFVLWWGLLVGVGTGSLTMVFGATVANRWFRGKIGTATGLLTAASVFGQFALLPLLSLVLAHGEWRGPVLVCGGLAVVALIVVRMFLRDSPDSIGVDPYGVDARGVVRSSGACAAVECDADPFARTVRAFGKSLRDRRFWILAVMFALCGATTNGLMWSHFTPAAHDHGMGATAASSLLAVIGVANILGTVGAGWLTDRVEPRVLLAVFFLGRGVALAALPFLFGSGLAPDLVAFAVVFGILDVATVPPTLALCRHYFAEDSALTFGFVSVFHQIGAGAMALTGGLIREVDGSYTAVWISAAAVCAVAAVLGGVTTRVHRGARVRKAEVDAEPSAVRSRY